MPGDLVLSISDSGDYHMKSGIIVAVISIERESHWGCDDRLLVLWVDPIAVLSRECDCGLILPIDINL